MADTKFWEIIRKFNFLMKNAIKGPDCLNICNSDCCSIQIDIPKILAEEYINQGYANKEDFIRGNVFSFKLRFDVKKGKCFLFDKSINGCLVHNSGIKPPQCWIYPTKFSNIENKEISCKKANGWRIIDSKKAREAEELLQYYNFLCQLEARKEKKYIKVRLSKSLLVKNLKPLLKRFSPYQISGFKDSWDCFTILPSEGISLQLKKFCHRLNTECEISNFLNCNSICNKVSEGIINFLQQNLYEYVQKNGLDSDGEYLLLKMEKKVI